MAENKELYSLALVAGYNDVASAIQNNYDCDSYFTYCFQKYHQEVVKKGMKYLFLLDIDSYYTLDYNQRYNIHHSDEKKGRDALRACMEKFANDNEDVFFLTSDKLMESFDDKYRPIDWDKWNKNPDRNHDFYHNDPRAQREMAVQVCSVIRAQIQKIEQSANIEHRVIVASDSTFKSTHTEAGKADACQNPTNVKIRFMSISGAALCASNKNLLKIFAFPPDYVWETISPLINWESKTDASSLRYWDLNEKMMKGKWFEPEVHTNVLSDTDPTRTSLTDNSLADALTELNIDTSRSSQNNLHPKRKHSGSTSQNNLHPKRKHSGSPNRNNSPPKRKRKQSGSASRSSSKKSPEKRVHRRSPNGANQNSLPWKRP